MAPFEIPLDIEDVEIEQVAFTPTDEMIITVTSTVAGTQCHRCGKNIKQADGEGRESRLRH